jgi:hypothetical protein
MTERGDRLRVGVPISAPCAKLQGARQRAERRRASRMCRRPCGEGLAVYEDELEVLAACSLHLLRVRVVPMRERLQERAGRGRGRRVGGTGGARRGGLMMDRIMLTNSYSVSGWGGQRTWELPASFIGMSVAVVGSAGSGSLACLQSKVIIFWGGQRAHRQAWGVAYPELVLLQAERVEQRRKLNVELNKGQITHQNLDRCIDMRYLLRI